MNHTHINCAFVTATLALLSAKTYFDHEYTNVETFIRSMFSHKNSFYLGMLGASLALMTETFVSRRLK